MNAHKLSMLLVGIACTVLVGTTDAGAQNKKLAQTGMKFLQIGNNARGASMAEALTSLQGGSEALFYNPAGMARLNGMLDINLGQTQWIADINQLNASLAISPFNGDYGVLGFSFISMDYGDIPQTVLAENDLRYIEIGTFKPTAVAFGLGYARALTDKFSVGGHLRWVTQSFGDAVVNATFTKGTNGQDSAMATSETITNKLTVNAFDFGILYLTGYKSLAFGMSLRNFSEEVKYVSEGFQLPLTFQIGISMNVMDLAEDLAGQHALYLSANAEHPRDYPEQIRIGAEYVFMNTFAARVGYVSPADEHSLSYGFGVKTELAGTKFGADFAYTPFGIFDTVTRLNLHFGF